MLNKVLTAGAVVAGLVSFAPMALALPVSNSPGSRADKNGQFYATPIQKGAPRDLPGEQLIPGAPLVVDVIDGVTRPLIVDPIQGAGASIAIGDPLAPITRIVAPGPAAAPAPAVKAKRHARGHHGHHAKKVAGRHHKHKKAG